MLPLIHGTHFTYRSTSNDHQKIIDEQSDITTRIGLEVIEKGLHNTHLTPDDAMDICPTPLSRTVEAKRRAIGRYQAVSHFAPSCLALHALIKLPPQNTPQRGTTAVLGLAEAIEIEQKAHVAALERQKQKMEKRMQRALTLPGEELTREEREARLLAFMYVLLLRLLKYPA